MKGLTVTCVLELTVFSNREEVMMKRSNSKITLNTTVSNLLHVGLRFNTSNLGLKERSLQGTLSTYV